MYASKSIQIALSGQHECHARLGPLCLSLRQYNQYNGANRYCPFSVQGNALGSAPTVSSMKASCMLIWAIVLGGIPLGGKGDCAGRENRLEQPKLQNTDARWLSPWRKDLPDLDEVHARWDKVQTAVHKREPHLTPCIRSGRPCSSCTGRAI